MYLLDTNVLLRLSQPGHPQHAEARNCIRAFFRRKERPFIVPQVLFEYWVVATRPVDKNGLGLSVDKVKRKVEKAPSFFQLRLDSQAIYAEWLRLVGTYTYTVSGVAAHDARIVAAMKVHGLTHLITFNIPDFNRYAGTEITVFSPFSALKALEGHGRGT